MVGEGARHRHGSIRRCVRITDRGPWVRGRVLDLSLAAARSLGVTNRGVAQVRAEVL
ncbi:hypothetical protein BST63_16765 [Bradyrhizobium canariense]|uniref:RlpA-like protein double-psi beta-barrel domain-containing protein n=1 Tax=Bradyrhizobium canariense TaxID=255045 RepID=A0ABX3X2G5_9BRAD|nr:hypothetical protein BSR47_19045 [Bradyrhizobium canariense]OSJ28399.1 hypothetical protein BST63_16765 [Bradyrhizobium canariense]